MLVSERERRKDGEGEGGFVGEYIGRVDGNRIGVIDMR